MFNDKRARPLRRPVCTSTLVLAAMVLLLMGLTGMASAKITDGYPAGKKIHMVGGNNAVKLHLGFILNIQEELEDRLVLKGNFREVYPIYLQKHQALDLDATHNLGLMYLRGLGVPKDLDQAIGYLKLSMSKDSNWNTANIFYQKALKERAALQLEAQADSAGKLAEMVVKAAPAQAPSLAAAALVDKSVTRTAAPAPQAAPSPLVETEPTSWDEVTTLVQARKLSSNFAGLSDDVLFELVHDLHFPDVERAELAKRLNYVIVDTTPFRLPANTGALVLWALLAGGLGGYFWMRLAERKAGVQSTATDPSGVTGIHGWLRFFIVCLGILGPMLTLGNLAGDFQTAEKLRPALRNVHVWLDFKNTTYLTAGAYFSFCIFAALQLRFRRKPVSVTLAVIALISLPVVCWAMGVTIPAGMIPGQHTAPDNQFSVSLIGSIFSVAIWLAYLLRSKQVRETYRLRPVIASLASPATFGQPRPLPGRQVVPAAPEKQAVSKPGADDALYEKIAAELDSGQTHKPTWLKSFVHANGDENVAKAKYIQLRLEALQHQ